MTQINTLSPMERLNQLQGLDNIREQFEKYRAAYKRYVMGETRGGFRPHMAFMGNPGTGKTTVARLFGEILHEEGLLPQGQFVEATVGDMISQYIGETKVKAGALCDSAKGGVLFIDEAYGLMSGAGGHGADFGQEAIEVLIQFMENNDDSLVIVAGYPEETKRLINDGNPGFKSRFNQDLGFFYFEDYTDEQLWEILKLKLNTAHLLMDERACEEMALNYFASLPRDSYFGNARVLETLIPVLRNNLDKRYAQAIEEQRKDPDFAMRILPEDFPNYGEPSPMDKLNRLIGIDPIREQFERYLKLFHYCRNNPQTSIGNAFRPHMVFMGNPGTGKTTVARLFATILKEKGLLSNDSFVEVSPTDLVGLYVGQTARQARMRFERAKGGVLFIDEAYALNRGMNDYHLEALEALFKFMEDERDTIVILAGYTNAMQDMLNDIPGLLSRFTNEFVFEDFKPNDLFEILMSKLGEHETSENFKSDMRQIIQIQFEHRDPTIWGNARTMENYATEILGNFIAKHNATGIIDTDCIPESIMVVKIKLNQ